MAVTSIQNRYSKSWGVVASWNTNVTISDLQAPAAIVVMLWNAYGEVTSGSCTIGGLSASVLYSAFQAYGAIKAFYLAGLPANTYSVNVSGVGTTHPHAGHVFSVHKTLDVILRASEMAPTGQKTYSPNLSIGDIYIELYKSCNVFSWQSGQTQLVENMDGGDGHRGGVLYRQDLGAGVKSSTVTFPATDDNVYVGLEAIPLLGKIFDVPPMLIG